MLTKSNLPKSDCPYCGYAEMDSADSLTGSKAAPEPDDITLCLNCGALLKFLFDLKLAKLWAAEKDEIYLDSPHRQMIIDAQALIKQRGRFK
jgi:hypothetical protein